MGLWGATLKPTNIVFKDSVAVNPGILKPNWYGNCVATYGLQSVVFKNLVCRSPTLKHPIPMPYFDDSIMIDTSMFVFYSTFSAGYPVDNSIAILGWSFQDLDGNEYTASAGSMDTYETGKMTWKMSDNGVAAPYYIFGVDRPRMNVFAV